MFEQANGASLYYNADLGRLEQHIFFLGDDGSLNHSWFDQNTWASQKLPGSPVTWPIALPFYGNLYPELHVFYRDVSGRLGHTFWGLASTEGGSWFNDILPGKPLGNLAAGNYGTGETHVFYEEADGRLHQTFRGSAVAWTPQPLPGLPNVELGVSTLDWKSPAGWPFEQHVFYVENGQLAQSWFDGKQWNQQALPGRPAGPPASIINYEYPLLQHVYFVGDGKLQQSWYDGNSWNNQTLPGSPLGTALQAAEYHNPSTGMHEEHVFYTEQGGQLGQSWWDGRRWNQQTLPGRPSRIIGVGNYFPTRRNTLTEQHVFFRADDGSLQQSWYDGRTWNTQALPAATPLNRGFGASPVRLAAQAG